MITRLHEIRLSDVILLDATKDASILKKYWFIPLWMCRKELEKLGKQIFDSIGGSTVQDLEDQFDKLNSYRKLQILEALYKALEIELKLKSKITTYKILLEKEYSESKQLKNVIEEIKKYTGIEIKNPDDLKTFYDHVQYKIDKHNEMYPETEVEEKEETPLIDIFYSVFSFMGEPFNDEMLLIAFIGMQKMAKGKILKQSNTEDNEQLE